MKSAEVEGASAVVARVVWPTGERVALKVAKPGFDGVLAREAILLARVGPRWSPSLVAAGRVPAGADRRAGATFVATRWFDGQPLADDERDREGQALVVAHGVGRALDELARAGVRHGDVKRANILVRPGRPRRDRADERAATLLDLGLAAPFEAPMTGGTPRSLAPELRAGEPASVHADVWALGLVLAEILVPAIAAADDPVPLLPRAFGQGEVGRWIEALVSPTPGSRPSAAWIAARAARLLGLEPDDTEIVEGRRARVRRAYLAARGDELAPSLCVDPRDLSGAPRRWLGAVAETATRVDDGETLPARPLSPFGKRRWIVGVAGAAAASWPLPDIDEATLAERLEVACARIEPEAITPDDLAGRSGPASEPLPDDLRDRALVLVRSLVRPSPREDVIVAAETLLSASERPIPALAVELARACVRRGEVGRAFAVLHDAHPTPDALALRADVARRRGALHDADELARAAGAIALRARVAWDQGKIDEAERLLGDATGALAAEVRGLVAYARGDLDRGLRAVEAARHGDHDVLGLARLEGTRGMLLHARGDAAESAAAFARAVDLSSREGALVEEATYLTGLAAAAVDAGAAEEALGAATRAALIWERLGRPALATRALLSRAAAFAMIGARHEADAAADDVAARARNDPRAAAYARWARVETRPAGEPRARDEARAADVALADGTADDRVRAAARLLVWAEGVRDDGSSVDEANIDDAVERLSPVTRWEWWGARATRPSASPRILAAVLALLDVPAPLASRGPALAAALGLAERLGDGEAARRLETARFRAAEALRAGAKSVYVASIDAVGWAAQAPALSATFGAPQIEQLDAIVRALSSRDRLRPLLEQVLDTMVLWTGVERGLLLLRAPSGRLVPRTARNLARHDLRGEQLSLSMSLATRAMEERKTVVATDAYAQVGDVHASVHALRLRSVLAVPLVARGDVLGVVYLDDRVRRGAFGPAELAWVRLVASQAALAIADARDQALLRRAARKAERAKERLAEELGRREAELASARAELSVDTKYRYDEISGRSEAMRVMLHMVDRVTNSDVPVLLVGESGTGKELVARAIHQNGARGRRSFVGENCASLPETLLETTLFGHVRGAFTGASATRAGLFDVADGGTLFLDEIGEMSLGMQTKLLRVLQEGEVRPVGAEKVHRVDVRIVGATHRDLSAMVAAGTFREDLFYRLNVVAIRVPPLRERSQDIPLLATHFIQKHGEGKKLKITRAAMDRLAAYPWPGNVRQLENELRRAIVLADDRVDLAELSDEVARGGPSAARDSGFGLKGRVDALETQLVKDALARTKGNQTRAAALLGVSRFGLQKMMRRLGIEHK